MTSGFVKTAVLNTGEVFHGEETRIESDEVKRQEFRLKEASKSSLYDQLQENEDKKQAEYDAVSKMMFAPTKALDEEEAEHFNSVEDRKKVERELIRMQESIGIDSFKAAQLNRTIAPDERGDGARGGQVVAARLSAPVAAPVETNIRIKAKKRKGSSTVSNTKSDKKKKEATERVEGEPLSSGEGKKSALADSAKAADQDEDNPLAALGSYGDSDSD